MWGVEHAANKATLSARRNPWNAARPRREDPMPLDAQPEILHSTCPHDCHELLCAGSGEAGPEPDRSCPRREGQQLYRRRHLRKGRALCRAGAPSRPAENASPPHRRKGLRSEGFEPISWEDALDIVADNFQRAEDRFGSETVWPYQYAGTMGLVQRDGIHRLRHAKKYSRQHDTICSSLANAGWRAGAGVNRGVDCREMEYSDQIVMWGGNPGVDPGECDAPHHPGKEGSRGEAGGRRSLPHGHGRAGRPACDAATGDGRGACLVR